MRFYVLLKRISSVVLAVCVVGCFFFIGNAQDKRVSMLFLNKNNIDTLSGVTLKMHNPIYSGVAFYFDEPWEGSIANYTTIIKDGNGYKAYYRGRYRKNGYEPQTVTCLAESQDGIFWYKPHLSLFNMGKEEYNNVILAGEDLISENFSPFIDNNPQSDSDKKYKAIGGAESSGLFLLTSSDGINWSKLSSEPFYTKGNFDSQNILFWDEYSRSYLLYFRKWIRNKETGRLFRSIGMSKSSDLKDWSDWQVIDLGKSPVEDLYTSQIAPYYRNPRLLIGIGARLFENKQVVKNVSEVAINEKFIHDCSDVYLMSSVDGLHFDRTFMESFIRPGIGLQNWTSRTNYPALNVVQTSPTEMSIYVNKNYLQKDAHLARYSLRIDGFTSVNAKYDGGFFITKSLILSGDPLIINYSTSAAGEMYVELLDSSNEIISGFSKQDCDVIIGDEISRVVTWGGNEDLSSLKGKEVKLKFYFKDADLFSVSY